MVGEERYKETVDAWVENERDRIFDEGDLEGDDGPEVIPPDPTDAFDAEELPVMRTVIGPSARRG